MQTVPLSAQPNQALSVELGGQSCDISVYTLPTGLYCDLSVSGSPIVSGVLCHDRCLIVRDAYLGFSGDLAFIDTQGTSDPVASGLGDRFQLLYLAPGDL